MLVRFGPAPARLANSRFVGERYEVAAQDTLIRFVRVGTFRVRNGCEVVIERGAGATDDDVRVLLFGGVLGALLHQRRRLALHGGCVAKGRSGLIVLGASGAGKSSVVTALLNRGWQLLDDNVAVIDERDDGWWIEPGLGELRLREDVPFPAGSGPPSPFLKTQRKAHASIAERFQSTPAALKAVYMLQPCDAALPTLTPLVGAERFLALNDFIFCRRLSSAVDDVERFPMLQRLAAALPVSRLERPLNGATPEAVADLVDAHAAGIGLRQADGRRLE